jgi:hypothetical protein
MGGAGLSRAGFSQCGMVMDVDDWRDMLEEAGTQVLLCREPAMIHGFRNLDIRSPRSRGGRGGRIFDMTRLIKSQRVCGFDLVRVCRPGR